MSIQDLTARQCEVIELVAKGAPNKVISAELEISAGTVKQHLSNIFSTLKVRNRTQAALAWIQYRNDQETQACQ